MNTKPVILLIALFAGLQACSNRPSVVLSDRKMEDVLFDIHIADAEIENNYQLFSQTEMREIRRKQLYDAVFEKHGISFQSFDTSLVWYSGNLDRFVKIYDRINERYTLLQEQLNGKKNREEEMLRSGIYAVNRWKGARSASLEHFSSKRNRFLFRVDSLTHLQGTICELQFSALGISPDKTVKALLYAYLKDTFLIQQQTIEYNGNNLVKLNTDSMPPLKNTIDSIWGLIQLEQGNSAVIIHNIQVHVAHK